MVSTTWSNEYLLQEQFVRNLNNILNMAEQTSVPAPLFNASAAVTEAEIIAAWQVIYGDDITPPAGALVHSLNEAGDTLYSTYRRSSRQDEIQTSLNFGHLDPKPATSYKLLASSKLAADAANMVISVPADYTGEGLELVVFARSVGATAALDLTINGVTGANYNLQMLEFQAAGLVTYQNTSITTLRVNNAAPGNSATPYGAFSHVRYLFPSGRRDLTGLAFFHPVLIEAILCNQPAAPAYAAAQKVIARGGGVCESVVPITTLTLAASAGNLVRGTEAFLYGIDPQ